jgi:hypothetical protein
MGTQDSMDDVTKKTLSVADATRLLEARFAQLRSESCNTCKVPAPIWGPGVVSGTSYWYLKMLPPCPSRCAQVITKIWAEITTEYQIVRSAQESGQAHYREALEKAGAAGRTRRRGQFRKLRAPEDDSTPKP